VTVPEKPSILVADDDPDICANVSDILCDLDYQVDTALNGPSALELVSRQPCDVALLDPRIPGMGGLLPQREIKKSGGTVTLLATAFAGAHTAEQALTAGMWKTLAKAVDFPSLLHVVEQAIDQSLIRMARG
jgi:CheY-like chemotaxis protein